MYSYLWILLILSVSEGYKILVVFPVPAGSHRNLGDGYVRHLLKAGHEVTYITPFVMENFNPNLRQIHVADNFKAINAQLINIKALMSHQVEMDQDSLFQFSINITKTTLESEAVQKLLNDASEEFDVVIAEWMFNDIYCGFSAVFNCPYIWSFSYEPNFVSLGLLGEATNPAYTANIQLSDVPPFNFWQRTYALWFQVLSNLKQILFYENIEKEFYEKTFTPIVQRRGRNLPPYDELRYNASMVLGSSHVSLGQAIRLPQNYIPIAGYHIDDDTKPLPEDLQRIMENAEHGVIYFSLGSNLKSKDLPENIKNNLLTLFGELNQTVLWKIEQPLPNKPKNVHFLEWAPQHSILGHPNCILFITHGGLLSTTEAVHFGVPFIGIPVFFDQNFNVEQSVQRGIAKKVILTNNIDKDLRVAINEILNDSKYYERINETSFIYHHRPVPPGKELVHWVEHVVRSGGALLHRSPARLVPWYQKMFLDLIALIVVFVFVILQTIKFMSACILRPKVPYKKKIT
ncbi:unnamed protein product [Parnassius apollo]|uniref:(apollo) hypothetical protein n=1 Tax=Parnassius apollo TaxID=110799 RepID=A0A8S3YA76_PARAO|nr:unnamed protein product [Parnassius apollo]